uniref:Uncharacterized protein n=1 Tax=Arundo donax TaxID=35708 RepID=A0A0A9GLN1_ARUDO
MMTMTVAYVSNDISVELYYYRRFAFSLRVVWIMSGCGSSQESISTRENNATES